MGRTALRTRGRARRWKSFSAIVLAGALWLPSTAIGAAEAPGVTASQVGVGTPCQEQTDSVRRLYFAYFGREPEQGGFDFWVEQYQEGDGLANMSEFFAVGSQEFLDLYGDLSDTEFVRTVYQSVLGREPDLLGLQFWVNQLQSGVRRGTVMLSFSESEEFVDSTSTMVPVAGYLRWFPAGTTWVCGTGSGRVPIDNASRFADLTIRNTSSVSESARIRVVGLDGVVKQTIDLEIPGDRIRNVANIPADQAAEIEIQTGSDIRGNLAAGTASQESSSLSYTLTQYDTPIPEDRPGWSEEGVPIPTPEPAGPTAPPPTDLPPTDPPPVDPPPSDPPPPADPPPTDPPPPADPPPTDPPPPADPPPTDPPPPADPPPREETNITSQGEVSANTSFPGFDAGMAVDGNVGTSWFSTGPGQGDSIFTWFGPDAEISRIEVIGNGSNFDPANRTGFGFDSMTVEVLNDGLVVFSQEVSMAGTPDVPPPVDAGGVMGDSVRLTLRGHESLECGGFAELRVIAFV